MSAAASYISPDPALARALFQHLEGRFSDLSRRPTGPRVHHFRTAVRRLETLLEAADREPGKAEVKLLKELGKLRRRAGKMRDLDIQIAALKGLHIGPDGREKRALLEAMEARRHQGHEALVEALGPHRIRRVSKRLKQVAGEFDGRGLRLAVPMLPAGPLHAGNLHEFRKAGKQRRYVVELAPTGSALAATAGRLKWLQDQIGEWHDWAELTRRAEKQRRGHAETPLLAAVRNLTAAKLRQALEAAETGRREMAAPAAARRPPGTAGAARPAAARTA